MVPQVISPVLRPFVIAVWLATAVDLADLRSDGARHGDRRQIGRPTPERRDLVSRREPLEPRQHDDVAGLERLDDPFGPDLDDLGLAVLGVGDDAGLGTRVAGGPATPRVEGDAEQRHGDPLARREQHVHLAWVGDVGDL